ncbi:MAG: hypothetical protein C0509_03360 [Acinetobacter sp.]|nr:hypothetical protein [Acinetobacter sp.]
MTRLSCVNGSLFARPDGGFIYFWEKVETYETVKAFSPITQLLIQLGRAAGYDLAITDKHVKVAFDGLVNDSGFSDYGFGIEFIDFGAAQIVQLIVIERGNLKSVFGDPKALFSWREI